MWRGFPFADYQSHGHAVWALGNEFGTCVTFWHNRDLGREHRGSVLPCRGRPRLCADPLSPSSRLSGPRPGPLHPLCVCFCLPGLTSSSPPPAPHQLLLPRPPLLGSDERKQQLLLQSFEAHGLRLSVARGIFPDQGSNPHLLHWQADSSPRSHQGSPLSSY